MRKRRRSRGSSRGHVRRNMKGREFEKATEPGVKKGWETNHQSSNNRKLEGGGIGGEESEVVRKHLSKKWYPVS